MYNTSADFKGVDGVTTDNATGDKGRNTLVLLGFGGEKDDTRYQNPYGGYYELANSSSDRSFTITITNLGQKICTVLKKRSWPAGGTVMGTDTKCAASGNGVQIKYGKADSSMNP